MPDPSAAQPAILFANDAFYAAFADGDPAAMDALWARRAPVSCIHPGQTALTDRAAIMASWRDILGAGPATIRAVHPVVFPIKDAAWVTCHEILPNGTLIATNVFVREDGAWRMVHHHAGPAPLPEAAPDDERKPTLQ